MTFIDLFSGIGGFALGAEWAGFRFDHHYYSEVDEYANKIYTKRFPDAVALGDIIKVDWGKLRRDESLGDFVIAGGFP